LVERGTLHEAGAIPLPNSQKGEARMSVRTTPAPGDEVVYTKYITLRNGKRLYAFEYGLNAFRIVVKRKRG